MRGRDPRRKGMGAVEVMEEAVALLRRAPVEIPAAYYIGTLPFVLGMLYFWTDMSTSPFAQARLPGAAFGMALLYLWMKLWQSVFAARVLAHISGEQPPRFPLRRILRMFAIQTAWQPFGLFAIPISFLLMLPFGWVFAYYHNLAVTGDGEESGFRGASRNAWTMALLWSGQNHTVIALVWLLWLLVYLNVGTILLFLPELIRMLTGVETVFTLSGFAVFNTTFFAVVAGITHLCINPMLKTVYILRCFYGQSLHSGADLKSELNAAARESAGPRVAGIVVAVLLMAALAPAEAGNDARPTNDPARTVSPQQLDDSIDRVISKREYQWRSPRGKEDVDEDRGAIIEFLQGIRDWIVRVTRPLRDLWRRVVDWLRDLTIRDRSDTGGRPALSEEQLTLLLVLLAAATVILGLFLWRVWRRKKEAPMVAAQAVTVVPDLKDENVVASQLPEEEWQALAADLMMKGELRLAMRALYMASLAFLAGRSLLTIARYKSNRDYQRELLRRARERELLMQAFSENIVLFERSWYGTHEVTPQLLETFDVNHDRIRTYAQE